jgi:hypothetical protein
MPLGRRWQKFDGDVSSLQPRNLAIVPRLRALVAKAVAASTATEFIVLPHDSFTAWSQHPDKGEFLTQNSHIKLDNQTVYVLSKGPSGAPEPSGGVGV